MGELHPHFTDQHVYAVREYLEFLKLSLKKHYDGPGAVVDVKEDRRVTEVTVNGIPVFRVTSRSVFGKADEVTARWVVQDWVPEFP